MPHCRYFASPIHCIGNSILVTFYWQGDTLSIDRESDYRLINSV